MIGATLFADEVGFTTTVAVPDLVVSCVEVAVTVTLVAAETMGAVNRPEEDICPAFALQVTAELKFPVPMTVAEHWLVWPDVTVLGEHDAVTDVMVVVPPLLLPPPQAAISMRLPIATRIASLRTIFSPSAYVADLDALRH
jgi:hypothetical protein